MDEYSKFWRGRRPNSMNYEWIRPPTLSRRLLPPCRRLYPPLPREKNSSHRAKLFVLSLGGRLSAERNVMTPVTNVINESEKARRIRFKDRIRRIDTWIFQKTHKRPDDGKFSPYEAPSIFQVKKDTHFRRPFLKITKNSRFFEKSQPCTNHTDVLDFWIDQL